MSGVMSRVADKVRGNDDGTHSVTSPEEDRGYGYRYEDRG